MEEATTMTDVFFLTVSVTIGLLFLGYFGAEAAYREHEKNIRMHPQRSTKQGKSF